MVLLETILGFIIGLTLGLLGGGGSILTVPALVYMVGQSPHVAITASLIIVGLNAMIGVWFYRKQGVLDWKVAFTFGGVGMITAYLAASVSHYFSETLLMSMFALLMLVVGVVMIVRKPPSDEQAQSRGLPVVIASGATVGLLTGFLGVGGGFLIVPALVMLVGLPIRSAIGTSLIIIAMNSLAGVLGHLGAIELDYTVIGIFVVAGIAGTFAGSQLTKLIRSAYLQRIFAVFIIGLGLFLLYDNLRQVVVLIGMAGA